MHCAKHHQRKELVGLPAGHRVVSDRHRVVSPIGLPGERVDTALAARGLERCVVMSVPYFLSAPWLVAHSQMVLTAPRCLLAPMARYLPLRMLPVPIPLPPFVVAMPWPARMTADPGHRWLRDAITASAEAEQS